MKKIIYLLSVITLITGVILVGCEATQKEDTDKTVKDTVVVTTPEVVVIVATTEEWRLFKLEAEEKIKANEIRIAELKVKLKRPGKVFDKMYENKIAKLEEKNTELRVRIVAYEETKTDWQKFKEEFNHDMDELGKALKDITVDNK